jgi:HlyD family secretion protein
VKKLLLVLVLVALVLAGGAYYTQYRISHSTENGYTTAPVDFGEMRDVISATAVLQPLDLEPILSKISGQVVELHANIGDTVEEGQPLARLDQRDAQNKRAQALAAVRTAEAGIRAANAKLEEAKVGLNFAQKAIDATKELPVGPLQRVQLDGALRLAERTVNTAEFGVALAESQKALAKTKLDEADYGMELTTIRAPGRENVGGQVGKPATGVPSDEPNDRPKRKFVVLKREVVRGQNIDTKQLLFTLAADLGEMQAHALIPESQINRVAKGQEAKFWVDALGEENKMPATVTAIREAPANLGLQGAVSFEVVLNVKNEKNEKNKGGWQLKTGMTAQIEITDRIHRGVWKLPVNARSFTLEDQYLTTEAKQEAADAEKRLDMNTWSKIWILRDKKPWPAFVRLSGIGVHGETGIKDAEYHEILEWDAQTKPALNPKDPKTFPEIIIGAPPKKNGLFEISPIKL